MKKKFGCLCSLLWKECHDAAGCEVDNFKVWILAPTCPTSIPTLHQLVSEPKTLSISLIKLFFHPCAHHRWPHSLFKSRHSIIPVETLPSPKPSQNTKSDSISKPIPMAPPPPQIPNRTQSPSIQTQQPKSTISLRIASNPSFRPYYPLSKIPASWSLSLQAQSLSHSNHHNANTLQLVCVCNIREDKEEREE